jgi:hypothetical protein
MLKFSANTEYYKIENLQAHFILIYVQQDATLHSLFYLETVQRCILLDIY